VPLKSPEPDTVKFPPATIFPLKLPVAPLIEPPVVILLPAEILPPATKLLVIVAEAPAIEPPNVPFPFTAMDPVKVPFSAIILPEASTTAPDHPR
jgi:hypothetical protein